MTESSSCSSYDSKKKIRLLNKSPVEVENLVQVRSNNVYLTETNHNQKLNLQSVISKEDKYLGEEHAVNYTSDSESNRDKRKKTLPNKGRLDFKKSYFINKLKQNQDPETQKVDLLINNLNFQTQKSQLLNHVLKKETKFADLDKIETFNKDIHYKLAFKCDKLLTEINHKNEILRAIEIEIEMELADCLILRKEMMQIENESITPKDKVLTQISFTKHALKCYQSVFVRLQQDKVLILKQMEREYSLSKINQLQYEKYIIIKENSFRTFEQQEKLRRDLKLYESMLCVKTNSNLYKSYKHLQRLELAVKNTQKNFDKDEHHLNKIRKLNERVQKDMRKIETKHKIILKDVKFWLKEVVTSSVWIQKSFYYMNVDNIIESLDKIQSQTIGFNSCFNYFKTKNKEIKEINIYKTTLQDDLSQEKLQLSQNKISSEQDAIDNPDNHELFKNYCQVKESNKICINKISKKENIILNMIVYFQKYDKDLIKANENMLYDIIIKNSYFYNQYNVGLGLTAYKVDQRLLSKKMNVIRSLPKKDYTLKDFIRIIGFFQAFIRIFFNLYDFQLTNISLTRRNNDSILLSKSNEFKHHATESSDKHDFHLSEVGIFESGEYKKKPLEIESINTNDNHKEYRVLVQEKSSILINKPIIKPNILNKNNKDNKIEKSKDNDHKTLIESNSKLIQPKDLLFRYINVSNQYEPENTKREIMKEECTYFQTKLKKELCSFTNYLVEKKIYDDEPKKKMSSTMKNFRSNSTSKFLVRRKSTSNKFKPKQKFQKIKKEKEAKTEHTNQIDLDDSYNERPLGNNSKKVAKKKNYYGMNIASSRTEDANKIYTRINDLQYLYLNLFKNDVGDGNYKVDNDFGRIFADFKRKK